MTKREQTPATSDELKLKDDPLGIEFARRVAGAHTKLTQDLISSAVPVKPKRWSGLVSFVTAAGNCEANVTLEEPVASQAPARPTGKFMAGRETWKQAEAYMDNLERRVRDLEYLLTLPRPHGGGGPTMNKPLDCQDAPIQK